MEPIRLLLVDDELYFIEAIAKRLKKRGMEALLATSGAAGLDILEKQPVDVVVSDVKMPGMSGLDLLGRIRERFPKIETILLTGHASPQDGVDGIKAGAFDYLTKPVEIDHLESKIIQAHDKIQREKDKLREAELREAMERQIIANKRLASLGTLAAGIAHEINNPLAIINEAAGWMRQILGKSREGGIERKADIEKALEKIETAVDRARRITHQLLGVVRETPLSLSEIDLSEFIADIIRLVEKETAVKHIRIATNLPDHLKIFWSDPFQLRQVLLNLLTNAVHASEENAVVTVQVQEEGQQILFRISDTGGGIPKEHQEKIFEPFFTTKPPGKGTGLGLFIVRGIVQRLQGNIRLESGIGKGACFSVSIPNRRDG